MAIGYGQEVAEGRVRKMACNGKAGILLFPRRCFHLEHGEPTWFRALTCNAGESR